MRRDPEVLGHNPLVFADAQHPGAGDRSGVRELDRFETHAIHRSGYRHAQSSSSSATARSTAATLPEVFGSA